MRSIPRFLVSAVLAVLPSLAAAQDPTAGWLAMVTTPYAALVPGVTPAMLGTAEEARLFGGDVEIRYGRINDGATVMNSFGIGLRFAHFGITGVWQKCDGCGSRSLAAVDYDVVIARVRRGDDARPTSFVLGLRPGVGIGFVAGEDDVAIALATTLDLPLSVAIPWGSRFELIPHLEPGFGNGIVFQGDRRDSRFHGTAGAGVTLNNVRGGVGFNVGWRQVLLGGAPGTWGAGLTLRRGIGR